MSSLLLDHIISIKRLTKDSDNADKESYVDNLALGAVKCQIQPATPEETAVAEGVFGQTYVCFTTQSGIYSGDFVTVSGNQEKYKVKGVEDWSQIQGIEHYEITLVKFEEEEMLI